MFHIDIGIVAEAARMSAEYNEIQNTPENKERNRIMQEHFAAVRRKGEAAAEAQHIAAQAPVEHAGALAIIAQRDALREALRQVAPGHHLISKTGRFLQDGREEIGDQTLYVAPFDAALREKMGCATPDMYRICPVGTKPPLYPTAQQTWCNHFQKYCISIATQRGAAAQRNALRAALREVSPQHALISPTGRFYHDGTLTPQIGDQEIYSAVFDQVIYANTNLRPTAYRRVAR